MKFLGFILLFVLIGCEGQNDSTLLPLEIGGRSYLIDEQGKKKSADYAEMHRCRGMNVSGTVLIGERGVMVLNHSTNQIFEFKPPTPYSPLLYAVLLKNNIVVLGRDGNLQEFYKNGEKIMESHRFIPSADLSRLLVKNNEGWLMLDEGLEVVRKLPDLNFRGTYDGVWIIYSAATGWGYLNIESGVDVAAEFHYLSNVVPMGMGGDLGFCVVATEPGRYFSATVNDVGISVSGGPYAGGGLWISPDGYYAEVTDARSSKIGIIDVKGNFVVNAEFEVFHIFNDATIFIRKENSSHWLKFSQGRLSKTRIPADISVRDVGLDPYYSFESNTHIGYAVIENDFIVDYIKFPKKVKTRPVFIRSAHD